MSVDSMTPLQNRTGSPCPHDSYASRVLSDVTMKGIGFSLNSCTNRCTDRRLSMLFLLTCLGPVGGRWRGRQPLRTLGLWVGRAWSRWSRSDLINSGGDGGGEG